VRSRSRDPCLRRNENHGHLRGSFFVDNVATHPTYGPGDLDCAVRLSTVILPIERWSASSVKWRRAEELGFHAAYTYDHLSWLRLRDRPWFGAVPTLTAASVVTSHIRLGPLVTSPNFRHPVPLAKDLLTIDDVSNGRLVIGVGSGGLGSDFTVLGESVAVRERTDRFVEFVGLLDELLRNTETSFEGAFYNAREARMIPGTLQQPRPPFFIAADGVRGMRLAARFAQGWITLGRSANEDQSCHDVVALQSTQLNEILLEAGREPKTVERLLLQGFSDEDPLASLDAFVDWAGRYQELGITELVIHWPELGSPFEADMGTFEQIATEGLSQLEFS
jgi:alkanesulfonate monooxygenase SsuD/methylene tetrahydromethanopterin reductase-like flavin-dependent oxidoreductase (luciferase family)